MLLNQIFAPLMEAPIEDFTLVGDFDKKSSFRHEQDRKLLSNPKAQAKIIQKWSKTVVPFNMIFINKSEVNKPSTTEVGEVTQEWLEKNMPKTLPELKLSDEAVNVIFTNNSGDERAPMTAWVIGHRFGHVIRRLPEWEYVVRRVEQTFHRILASAYSKQQPSRYDFEQRNEFDKMMTKFAEQVGTFRSAREGNIRNLYEFYYELFAQYLTTGKIRFNKVPNNFGYGRMAWGRATQFAGVRYGTSTEQYDEQLEILANELDGLFEDLLHHCVGRIFVM